MTTGLHVITAADRRYAESLDLDELQYEWGDTGQVTVSDGCTTDPDGSCPHGCPSPLIVLGFM